MTATTRLAILILTAGFVVEGVGEALEFASKTFLTGPLAYLYYAGPASTVVGFLIAFVGRHEWSELHRKHVLHAHRVLAFAIVALGAVIGTVFVLALYYPNAVLPTALPWGLGILAGVGLGSSFVSYLLIGYHLTSRAGKAFLSLALLWAVLVSAYTGYELASHMTTIIATLHQDPTAIGAALNSLTFVSTILFVSYFLLTAGFHNAYRQLQKGVLPPGHAPAVKPGAAPPKAPPPAPPASQA